MKRKGSAVVECALSAAIMLPLLSGMFEIGYGMYSYNRLQNAVRAGARYASLRSYDSTTNSPTQAFVTAVRNVVIYGSPEGGATPIVSGLNPEHVQLAVSMNGSMPANMSVSVSGFNIHTVFTNVQLNQKPKATFAYGGRYTAGF
jgi:Flp pilus assembly protein TadG